MAPNDSLQIDEHSTHTVRALVADLLMKNNWLLSTAESCTGGLIAASCTDLAGSSAWFERGFVTYSNAAKTEMLGVDAALIAQHGAVSEAVVRAMAAGALAHSHAQVAIAVTGIAGPSGGTDEKPVGTVWFGWASPRGLICAKQQFDGDRLHIRNLAVQYALTNLYKCLQHEAPHTYCSVKLTKH